MGEISLRLAAWVTAVCALLELVVGVTSNSLALTTDSGYMASDACALFMAIWALKNKRLRSYMMWLSSVMMLVVVLYMSHEAIVAFDDNLAIMSMRVFFVSMIGLLVNIWVSRGLVSMNEDRNIQVAHLHVICDMLGSAIAVLSGLMGLMGLSSKVDVVLTLVSAIGVGIATLIIMYKMATSDPVLELES